MQRILSRAANTYGLTENKWQIIGNDYIEYGFLSVQMHLLSMWLNFRISLDPFSSLKSTGYNELVAALQNLQGQLNKHGLASLAGRVTNVQSLLLGPVVARALHIRSAVLQRRRPRTQNAIRTDAKALAKEVSTFQRPTSILSLSFRFFNAILLTHKSFYVYFFLSCWIDHARTSIWLPWNIVCWIIGSV